MTALFALTPAAGLVRQDNKDAAYAGRRLFADHREPHARQSHPEPGLLAPTLKRHLDGRLDRSADLSLRDLRTCGRYLLRPGGLSPVADDRPHFYVLTLRAASTDAPSN